MQGPLNVPDGANDTTKETTSPNGSNSHLLPKESEVCMVTEATVPGVAASKPDPEATQREGSTRPAETTTEKGASTIGSPAISTLTKSNPVTVGDIVEK